MKVATKAWKNSQSFLVTRTKMRLWTSTMTNETRLSWTPFWQPKTRFFRPLKLVVIWSWRVASLVGKCQKRDERGVRLLGCEAGCCCWFSVSSGGGVAVLPFLRWVADLARRILAIFFSEWDRWWGVWENGETTAWFMNGGGRYEVKRVWWAAAIILVFWLAGQEIRVVSF